MPDPKRLILGNGEKLVVKIPKSLGWGGPVFPRTFDEARDRVINQVTASLTKSASFSEKERYTNELFLCFRLHPDMLAKSYEPKDIFLQVPDLKNVGSRSWRPNLAAVAQTERIKKERAKTPDGTGVGRLLFVQGTDEGFQRFLTKLNLRSSLLPAKFQEDIRKIEEIGFLHPNEQLQGFLDKWEKGRVELVLHPSRQGRDEQMEFVEILQDELGIPVGKSKIAIYGGGPAFVSTFIEKEMLAKLTRFNPLRTAHPLQFKGVPTLRSGKTFKAPLPPVEKSKSTIKVGIFDGGIDAKSPHLQGFVEEDIALSIKTPPMAECIEHGTAVAGALLYGPLERHDPDKPLPMPPVSVVSFRALPPSDLKDPELYECIDVIENAVPARPDISTFNVSFGPDGPILDDAISRFTFALDQLTFNNSVLFFVAVGNEGEKDPILSRIQSPSDLVHGVSVGAYTVRNGKRVRAPYSCKGPGREGGKIKPDICAYGGCSVTPIHLLSTTPGMKILEMGTSFASPIAASLGAQTGGLYDRATPLLSRVLITHSALHPAGDIDHELGHGCIPDTVTEVLNCPDKAVTIAFQGRLEPKTFYKLPIPLPELVKLSGTVQVSWTIATLCPVEMDHPGDYTSCCIEDTFYPNSEVFTFASGEKGGKKTTKKLHIKNDRAEILNLGSDWAKSDFPASRSGNKYPTEQEKRAVDYKWDTLVRRSVSLKGNSLYLPFLVLHAISRHDASDGFPYAAVVTIHAPKFEGDLHNEIVRRFPVLQPIRVRTEAEIRVKI